MKGKYGVPMNGMEHRQKKHYCKQCEYYKSKCSKKPKAEQPKQPTTCKHFKQKWKDAKASECITYHINDLSESERRRYERNMETCKRL